MLKLTITCDYCGDEIKGEYRKLRQEFTDKETAGNKYTDMCMNCLNAIISHRRLPVMTAEELKNAALQ